MRVIIREYGRTRGAGGGRDAVVALRGLLVERGLRVVRLLLRHLKGWEGSLARLSDLSLGLVRAGAHVVASLQLLAELHFFLGERFEEPGAGLAGRVVLEVRSFLGLLDRLDRGPARDPLHDALFDSRRLRLWAHRRAQVELTGAVLPLRERVGLLGLAAAGAGDLLELENVTYLLVAVAVAKDLVLGLLGASLHIEAVLALPDVLVQHLVDANWHLALLAVEGLVSTLRHVVAELEVLGWRGDELRRLLRLQVFACLDLLLAQNYRLQLQVRARNLLVVLDVDDSFLDLLVLVVLVGRLVKFCGDRSK